MNNFFKANDLLPVDQFVQNAIAYSNHPFKDQDLGKNKTIGLVFFNSSLRTRLSSIRAAQNLGANFWLLDATKDGWKLEMNSGAVMNGEKAEHIKEAIGVMSSYCDIIGVRAFPTLEDREYDYNEVLFNEIMKYSSVPLVNLESGTRHPLQSLADLVTMKQIYPESKELKVTLTWAPHPRKLPQSVANSFAEWCTAVDWIDLTIAAPKAYLLSQEFCTGAHCTTNQDEAFTNADIIYAKNWSSYENYGATPPVIENWMVTSEKMAKTNHAKFMHCLPVRRNVVVSDEVMDSPDCVVIQEATNRIYSAQAVFAELIKKQ